MDETTSTWQQVNVLFRDHRLAEEVTAARLVPALREAEHSAGIVGWFFVRKDWWRLRYRVADDSTAAAARAAVEDQLTTLKNEGHVSRWTWAVYEPETHAFGGVGGMAVAHDLFHRDSQAVLDYLRRVTGLSGAPDKRRELSLILCTSLMRGAGLDWYEQGDVWARVAANRPTETSSQAQDFQRLKAAVQPLLAADTSPGRGPIDSLPPGTAEWLGAFSKTGSELKNLWHAGLLTRGLRAVITHHVILHWNRLGIPYSTQGAIAVAARDVILEGWPPDVA